MKGRDIQSKGKVEGRKLSKEVAKFKFEGKLQKEHWGFSKNQLKDN